MPELPEVETVRRGLEQSITGRIIRTPMLRRKGLRYAFADDFIAHTQDQRIESVERRAKYLLLHLENRITIITHLGMSGRIIVRDHFPKSYEKHDHVVFLFDNKSSLVFNDARRFGFMLLHPRDALPAHKMLNKLGAEPLAANFTGTVLHSALRNKKTSIKSALMDQRVVAGLGNIYVCESLFLSDIHPEQSAHKISIKQADLLVQNIKFVLQAAIKSGGSTLRDYVRSSGDAGYFQHEFKVYGRENEKCFTCAAPIKRITQGGRSTFFCPQCQK